MQQNFFDPSKGGFFAPHSSVSPVQTPELPPPALQDLVAAARRLVRAFERLRVTNPTEWRLNVRSEWSGYGAGERDVYGLLATWSYLGGREVRECPRLFFAAIPDEVPGLPAVCRALWRCRRLTRRLDPTDAAGAVFSQFVRRILAAKWAAGDRFVHAAGELHAIPVAYPTELLDRLREWSASPPARPGAKPDPNGPLIAKRAGELRAAGVRWKTIAANLNEEFGVALKWRSLRRKWERWHQSRKSATD